jgi:hypothetical protein
LGDKIHLLCETQYPKGEIEKRKNEEDDDSIHRANQQQQHE